MGRADGKEEMEGQAKLGLRGNPLGPLGRQSMVLGMGIDLVGESLIGTLRTTTGTPTNHKHIWVNDRVGFKGGIDKDEYDNRLI